MVSLGKNTKILSSFSNNMNIHTDDEGQSGTDDNEVLIHSPPGEDNAQINQNSSGSMGTMPFRTLDTISVGIVLLISSIGIFTLSTILPIYCKKWDCGIKSMSILLYLQSLFWGISLICDQYIQYHHIRVRRRGYLDFYNNMRTLSQLPFWIVSSWSTLLLTITTILHDHCRSADDCGKVIRLKKINYVTICIGVESALMLIVLTLYLIRVWRFNSTKPLPDVLRDDVMNESTFGLSSIGPLDEEIYERQADMIHYYKECNAMLRKTVSDMSQQLSAINNPRA
jgi:hypothetical protein